MKTSLNLTLWTVAILVFPAIGVLPAAEDAPPSPLIDGTWRWTFTMPDGTTSRPRLVLETEDGHLTGTTSFRPGSDTAITNALLQGNRIRFQVIRTRGERQILTTYSGIWTGNTIRGQVESNWAGENQTYPWEARRPHEGAEGIWKWATTVRGRRIESRVKLEQEGDLLTGAVPGSGRGPRRVRVTHGSAKNGEIHFEIERGAGETKVVTSFTGKQTGDTIRGAITTVVAGKKQEVPWEAHRAE